MFFRDSICVLFFVAFSSQGFAQKDSLNIKTTKKTAASINEFNPLAPSKAAFYSAVFPGMGQIYNKKYWKAPIVWAGMATSTSIYLFNNNEYKRYRRAFRQRESGLQDEFTLDNGTEVISRNGLISAQRTLRNNRDLSLLATVLVYVLQIVEASVNAHLLQFDTSDQLSVKPVMISNPIRVEAPSKGLRLHYSF
ncbi:MAG: DUF5683 domain-containing protein [Flavobacteriales bacterium]|nr:DUF5683 domain-containing protein [Flavobacteriales bacterium]